VSLIDDGHVCEEILKSESKFQDIISVAVSARERSKNCEYHILDSQALTWVLRGIKPPKGRSIKVSSTITSYEQNYLVEVLSSIDDYEIIDSVKDSFYKSKAEQHLIYEYNQIVDEPRKSRVRVLTRMVWHHSIESE